MKPAQIKPALLFMVVALVGGHADQLHAQGSPPGQPRPSFMRTSPLLAALDADANQEISAAELARAATALQTLDKNGDGRLEFEEIRPVPPPNPLAVGVPEETVKTLLEFDRNADGKLAKNELPARFHGLLARGDANRDGVLSKEELKQMTETQAAPVGRPLPPPTAPAQPNNAPANLLARLGPAAVALDSTADGVISAEEINHAPTTLAQLDKNGDGKLTEDEVRPVGPPGGRGGGERPAGERPAGERPAGERPPTAPTHPVHQ